MTPCFLPSSYIAFQKFPISIKEMSSSNCIYVFTGIYDTVYCHEEESKQNLNKTSCKIWYNNNLSRPVRKIARSDY